MNDYKPTESTELYMYDFIAEVHAEQVKRLWIAVFTLITINAAAVVINVIKGWKN